MQKGSGAPAREPLMNEEEQKQLMAHFYRKQEEEKVCRPPVLLLVCAAVTIALRLPIFILCCVMCAIVCDGLVRCALSEAEDRG